MVEMTTQAPFCGVAKRLQRAWREDVAPVARHGTNQHADGGVRGTKSTTRDDADSILARLKRDDPMTAQAVKAKPRAGRGCELCTPLVGVSATQPTRQGRQAQRQALVPPDPVSPGR